MMSNSLRNLFIVLIVSGIILYLLNGSNEVVSEEFSTLSKIISGTKSIINRESENDVEEELMEEELMEEELMDEELMDEELMDEELMGQELQGEEIINEDLLGEEIMNEELLDEEYNVEEERKFKPTEKASNYAKINNSNQDFVFSGINQLSRISSTSNINTGQRIDSNISSNLINNMESEEQYSEIEAEQYSRLDQKLEEEEDFRKYLSSTRNELGNEFDEELGNEFDEELGDELGEELGEKEYVVKPYAEEELSNLLIGNEEEEESRGLFQEEESRGLYQEEESRGLFQEEESKEIYKIQEEENNFGEEENNFGEEENNFGEEEESITKQEMKHRFRHQVKCGAFIEPKYNKRINGCGTKSQMKLYKPMNKKLNDLRYSRSDNMPKAIKDVYNESIPNFKKKSKSSTCQHVQKGVTMNGCSNNFSVIGEETSTLDGNLYANDSCFDPYSSF